MFRQFPALRCFSRREVELALAVLIPFVEVGDVLTEYVRVLTGHADAVIQVGYSHSNIYAGGKFAGQFSLPTWAIRFDRLARGWAAAHPGRTMQAGDAVALLAQCQQDPECLCSPTEQGQVAARMVAAALR